MTNQPPTCGPQGLIDRWLERWHRDESGATMTEFIIMLPIFILVFHGVMELGQFTRIGSEPPIRAYKQTFEQALEYQKDFYAVDWNVHPTSAAASAEDQLLGTGFTAESSPVHNRSGAVEVAANAAEGATYFELGRKGHMGESNARTRTVGAVMDLQGCTGMQPPDSNDCVELNSGGRDTLLTNDLQDLVGDSAYAQSLLDDSMRVSEFSNMGGGAFSALSSALDGIGIRPAMAAGIRYGTVTGRHERDYSFAGRTVEMNAYFNTLVPPGTHGGRWGPFKDASYATAVSRITMEGESHYSDLIGIAWSQPLDSESFDVPDYP